MKVTFSINYHTQWGESIAVIISDVRHPLAWTEGDNWTGTFSCTAAELKDYTYAVIRDGIIVRPEWKHHSSALKEMVTDSWNACPIVGCEFTSAHRYSLFDIPDFRGAGTAVPVFSLRSADDFGIGDFRDLKLLVDLASATGQCVIQLLPVNDTTRQGDWKDSYPYSPVSSFALHPIYVRLQDLGIEETATFKKEQKVLQKLEEVDYPKVFAAKMKWVRKAWKSQGAADTEVPAFRTFCKDNSFWLDEYCEFCAQRDGDDPRFHAWLQYHLDRQFREVAAYAHKKGIIFKGDLPIGVSADSAEAHYHPELFNLDSSAGAPPDFFSADGQNWGFPTYNWEAMEKDGYLWWKMRLRRMSRWFDAFRIDHILGFFRIWEIPVDAASGKMGHFNPALSYTAEEIAAKGLPLEGLFLPDPRREGCWQPMISPDLSGLEPEQKERFNALHTDFFYHRNDSFWRRNAEKKLPELLGATGMLACGEDLGMVPDCVNDVMDRLHILSLEMPMMDKGRPWPRRSVCATSSHDMETLRMQDRDGDPSPERCLSVLKGCLSSVSMLAIFPLQDWLSVDGKLRRADRRAERINEPANPEHHWRYRLHLNLETLLSEEGRPFRDKVEGIIRESLRAVTRLSDKY